MPYAANNRVSTDPFKDSVPITQDEYAAAVLGMTEGKVVTIVHGKLVVDFPPAPEPLPEQLNLFEE